MYIWDCSGSNVNIKYQLLTDAVWWMTYLYPLSRNSGQHVCLVVDHILQSLYLTALWHKDISPPDINLTELFVPIAVFGLPLHKTFFYIWSISFSFVTERIHVEMQLTVHSARSNGNKQTNKQNETKRLALVYDLVVFFLTNEWYHDDLKLF